MFGIRLAVSRGTLRRSSVTLSPSASSAYVSAGAASPQTEALARRLADEQSVSIDDAVRQALEASAHAAGIMLANGRARVDQIVREIASMPVLDHRSPRDIMAVTSIVPRRPALGRCSWRMLPAKNSIRR